MFKDCRASIDSNDNVAFFIGKLLTFLEIKEQKQFKNIMNRIPVNPEPRNNTFIQIFEKVCCDPQ